MRMRVLSLHQPWASLMAHGVKRIETRSWSTNYRGLLAIHAAKTIPPYAREALRDPTIVRALIDGPGIELVQRPNPAGGYTLGPDATVDLPTGAILAVVNLFAMRSTSLGECAPDDRERHLGDYSPGRYAWYTNNLVRLAEPIEWRGGQGLRWADVPVCAVCRNVAPACGGCESDETRNAATPIGRTA